MFRIPSLHRAIRIVCLMVCVSFFFSTVQPVSASPPVQGLEITLTADQTNLTQGQCTILYEYIPEGWSLVQPLGMMWQANGCSGAVIQDSLEVCPNTTTTYTIYANYCDGTKQASVTINVSSPPPNDYSRATLYLTTPRMNGADVVYLQNRLLDLGYQLPNYGADGWFGDETDAAVREFQSRNGLVVDGIVGPITWEYLNNPNAVRRDIPPTYTRVPPTFTPIPPTSTPVSTSTTIPPTRTPVPPSATAIPPTQKPISTLIVSPRATQNNILELSVIPINQHLSPAITLSNGMKDYGEYDCFIASMSMALEYFRNQNILNADDTTSFRDLVPIIRGTTPPSISIIADPTFVSNVTNNKLSARGWYTTSENLSVAIETELKAGRPVVAAVPNWNFLAAQWAGRMGHAIFVYGLHDGKIFYVDPWDGNRYNMSIQDFANADTYQDGSFLITFEGSQ